MLAVLEALRGGSTDVAVSVLREDVVWLAAGRRIEGFDAVMEALAALSAEGLEWGEPQQQGAHAVLRHPDGGLVVETRRGVIVLAVALP